MIYKEHCFFPKYSHKVAIFFLLIADSSGYLLRKSTFDLKHFEGDVIELVQKTQIKGNILLSLKFQ